MEQEALVKYKKVYIQTKFHGEVSIIKAKEHFKSCVPQTTAETATKTLMFSVCTDCEKEFALSELLYHHTGRCNPAVHYVELHWNFKHAAFIRHVCGRMKSRKRKHQPYIGPAWPSCFCMCKELLQNRNRHFNFSRTQRPSDPLWWVLYQKLRTVVVWMPNFNYFETTCSVFNLRICQ